MNRLLHSAAPGGSVFVAASGVLLAVLGALSSGCESDTVASEPPASNLGPAEVCYPAEPMQVRLRIEPDFLALAPGQHRAARVVVDPDFCTDTAVHFESSNPAVAAAPADGVIGYGSPAIELSIAGGELGSSTLTATVARGDGSDASATVSIDVMEATTPACADSDDTALALLEAGTTIEGSGTLAGSTISLPAGADTPVSRSVSWAVQPFDAAIACGVDITPAGYAAMGPPVRFSPDSKVLPRELPLSVPINPALLPEAAHWRHLRVAYSGPAFRQPRTVPVTDPRVEKIDGVWRLGFKAPRLGTYQPVVRPDAGTRTRKRRITHRAILGVSMGGAGAAQFGLRHHQLFDVVAALGGPLDWTWLLDHIEHNQLAGFRPTAPGTTLQDIQLDKTTCSSDTDCQSDETCLNALPSHSIAGRCTLLPPTDEPYEHATTFNNWWSEGPQLGNGGTFNRQEYVQIFHDLMLMYGNPFGYNPLAATLPAGVDPDGLSQIGDHPNGECKIWVKPYDGPDHDEQSALASSCPHERCQYTQVLQGYYDDQYNPDGTFPVITFCDGSNKVFDQSDDFPFGPYQSSWWADESNDYPVEMALAVDYNGNGVRDELEPVITAGHEHWDDWGADQTPSSIEPGYGPNNLDPSGDDYDAQYNPTGTENNHRYDPGEPFRDDGLDGVDGTASSPYDWGEDDGEFTVSPGLARFWQVDPRSIAQQWSDVATTPLDDDALARLDVWTDGGLRDLFNSMLAARHLTGGLVARDRDTAYLSDFNWLPGLDPNTPDVFNPATIGWQDVPGVTMLRYGVEDPTAADLDSGTGMHVGTINEIVRRLQVAMYFVSSRWPDAPHAQVESAADKPAEGVDPCEIGGTCEFDFTSSFGRTGPVVVTLPPGYGHADLQQQRYPVLYVLHGYGMTPEDLRGTIAFLPNWMNGNTDSQASRLSKAILVYVDGRCRWQAGKDVAHRAECVRGTFYTDSIREDGPQIDAWFLELIDDIDQRYRTMGESTIDWTE